MRKGKIASIAVALGFYFFPFGNDIIYKYFMGTMGWTFDQVTVNIYLVTTLLLIYGLNGLE